MIDLSQIKILFFDIGNVFVSDDPSGCFIYKHLFDRLKASNPGLTPHEFFEDRTAHLQAGGSLWSFVKTHITDPHEFTAFQVETRKKLYSQWSAASPAIPGMDKVAEVLSRHYRMGIIANQPREVEGLLKERNLWDYFEIKGVSDALGMEKPNPDFFRWAIEQAGVRPEESLMIGDRLDNDVIPARSLGMKTLWIKIDADGRAWKPEDEFQECYDRSSRIVNWAKCEPQGEDQIPDFVAHNPQEIIDCLLPKEIRVKSV